MSLERRTLRNSANSAATWVTPWLVVLLVITVLNVYKPQGLTPYGWRKQQEARAAAIQRTVAEGRTEAFDGALSSNPELARDR